MLDPIPQNSPMLDEISAMREKSFQRSTTLAAHLEDPIARVATTRVVSCARGDTLSAAAQLMWDHDCGVLPVVDPDGTVLGMLTDRDALMAAHTRGAPLHALTVESAMSKALHSCRPDESIGHALDLMRARKVRRLPVLTKTGRLLGILSLADLARRLDRCPPASTELARTLAGVCESTLPRLPVSPPVHLD